LQERITPGQDIEASIQAIRQQGGLVLLPHPFDRLRGAVGLEVAERIKGQIDFIEVFNARCLFPASNAQALEFAKRRGLYGYAGSDAHTLSEYGNATNLIESFGNKEEFRENLRKAELTTKLSSKVVYLLSEVVKMRNRWRRQRKRPVPL
jgi:predicted metal-dependent phosphoesterase TrpH